MGGNGTNIHLIFDRSIDRMISTSLIDLYLLFLMISTSLIDLYLFSFGLYSFLFFFLFLLFILSFCSLFIG